MNHASHLLLLVALGSGASAGVLPSAESVQKALTESPRLQAAHESIAQGEAREQRLRAGPHEWHVAAGSQRRTEVGGRTFSEQDYGLERTMRWPWKASLDQRIGASLREAGELSYVDAWHEASRGLLALWFDWLESEHGLLLLDQQLQTLQAQLQAVSRRVESGDAPALEQQMAKAEARRAQAQRLELAQAALIAREALARDFPGLALQLPATLDTPTDLPEGNAVWMERIMSDNHEVELAEILAQEASLNAERVARERLADPTLALRFSSNLDGNRRLLGLSVSMPLGGPGRTADAALARSQARAADSTARQQRDGVQAAARAAIGSAHLTFRRWQELSEATRQLQQTAAATERGYALGEFDIAVLLAARRQAQLAEHEHLSAQLAALQANARLRLDAHLLWVPDHHPASHEDAGGGGLD